MSRIHFHTKNEDEAEVLGSERAHAHLLTSDLALAALGLASPTASLGGWVNPLIEALDPKIDCDLRYLSSLLRSGDDRRVFVGPDGTRHRVSSVLANTTLAIGSRPVRFLTRLHNQCEIHLWVRGKNRAWLADLIEEGMDSGVMRGGMGWDKVVTLLRLSKDGPVVTSFSVCEQFPNAEIAGWHPPEETEDHDLWYEKPDDERWDLAMKGLMESMGSRELTPKNLDNPRFFGTQVHGFELMEALEKKRNQPAEEARKARVAAAEAKGEFPSIMDS